jgi:hypothetical protein
MSFVRYIRPLPASSVSQADILSLTGRTELGPFDELWLVHHGEDGLCLEVIQPRFMFIDSQGFALNELQEWAQQEVYTAWMDQQEYQEAVEYVQAQQEAARKDPDPARDMFAMIGLEDFYDMMTERYGPPVVMTLQPDDPEADVNSPPVPPTLH